MDINVNKQGQIFVEDFIENYQNENESDNKRAFIKNNEEKEFYAYDFYEY